MIGTVDQRRMNMGSLKKEFCILLFIGLSASSFANVPLVGAFGFGIPFLVSLKTFGVFFILVAGVEAAIIRYYSKYPWRRSIRLSIIINTLSTLGGLVVFGFVPTPL